MTTRDSLLMLKQFGNVSATERKQRRRKVSEPSASLKKMHGESVSAPNWMRTERTDMRVRFEAASAKNAEAMTSNRDEKHLYVFVHGLGGSEDDLLALVREQEGTLAAFPKLVLEHRSLRKLLDEANEFGRLAKSELGGDAAAGELRTGRGGDDGDAAL